MATAKNRYLSDDHSDFTVDGRDAIVHLLRSMVGRDIVLCGAFNGGREVLLTAVLEVDPGQGIVYLDINANEERNQLFRASTRVVFFANFDGARVQWASSAIADDQYDGRQAFRIEIPETLQRIQRRTSYRVNTPVTDPVMCRVPIAEGEVELRLVDISVEGVGVLLPSSVEHAIRKGAMFERCRLEHPELGSVMIAVTVQNVWETELKNGTKSPRAGLEFLSIETGGQAKIQRFVYKMERLLHDTSKEE